jgi:two-component system response regulator YesN
MIISFLLMLIIPALTLLFSYIYVRELLQKENLNYQDAVLLQAQKMIDERLQSLQLFSIDISNDAKINAFLESDDLTGSALNFRVWEISQYMNLYNASYRNLCQLMIYSPHYDFLISSFSADSNFSTGLNRLDSKQLNIMLLEKLQNERLYCQYETIKDNQGKSELIMLHSVPLWSTGRAATGVICLLINTQELFYNISTINELKAGIICLVDENDQTVAVTGNTKLLTYFDSALDKGAGFIDIEDETYTISSANSSIIGWKYLSLQPEHVMLSKLAVSRNLSLFMLAMVLLLGIISAYTLSRSNYKPVENLMAALRKQSVIIKEDDNNSESEYHLIEHSVMDIATSLKMVRDTLYEELPRIQESVLMQLLKNAVVDYPTFKVTLEDLGVLMPYDKFIVVVIRPASPAQFNVESWAISTVIIKNQLMELISDKIIFSIVLPQSDIIVVVMNSDDDGFEALAKQSLSRLIERMRDEFSQMMSICVSNMVSSMEKVPHAYYTAIQFQHPEQEFHDGLHFLQDYNGSLRIEQSLDEISTLLQNFIRIGDAVNAIALLREKSVINLAAKNLALHNIRAYFIILLNIVVNAYPVEDRNELAINGADPLQLLFLEETTERLEGIIVTVIMRMCEQVKKQQRSHASRLAEQILQYINQAHADNMLTLSSVANKFFITPSYLSTFFKENVGDTFLNYLTHFRIDKAKELLRSTNLSMTEIATRVGYASSNNFARIFKKIEQITPTQYRDSSR